MQRLHADFSPGTFLAVSPGNTGQAFQAPYRDFR
jgi:hypothetical protein